jgi:uncharacterized protein YbaR (Trm112 family)
MPVSERLIEIIICPRTKQNLKNLSPERVASLNQQIEQGRVKFYDQSTVGDKLDEALITEDEKVIYRVDEGIPVLMVDKGIPTEQLEPF